MIKLYECNWFHEYNQGIRRSNNLIFFMKIPLYKYNKFADKVIRHNPPLPGVPIHALPDLNHDGNDHNKKKNSGALVQSISNVNQLLHFFISLHPRSCINYNSGGLIGLQSPLPTLVLEAVTYF